MVTSAYLNRPLRSLAEAAQEIERARAEGKARERQAKKLATAEPGTGASARRTTKAEAPRRLDAVHRLDDRRVPRIAGDGLRKRAS